MCPYRPQPDEAGESADESDTNVLSEPESANAVFRREVHSCRVGVVADGVTLRNMQFGKIVRF